MGWGSNRVLVRECPGEKGGEGIISEKIIIRYVGEDDANSLPMASVKFILPEPKLECGCHCG